MLLVHKDISHMPITELKNDSESRGVSRLTEMDRNGPTKIPKRTSMGTETDRNRLQLIQERTSMGTRKGGGGTIGTILIKLCMYW